MFVLWEADDSIAFIMNDVLLISCIHSEHPHYIHDFAFAMNDDFFYSFIHGQHPYNIHTISNVLYVVWIQKRTYCINIWKRYNRIVYPQYI
jgi:hypothetical protein